MTQDSAQALGWFRLAAKQGLELAQCALAYMYVDGPVRPRLHGDCVIARFFQNGAKNLDLRWEKKVNKKKAVQ